VLPVSPPLQSPIQAISPVVEPKRKRDATPRLRSLPFRPFSSRCLGEFLSFWRICQNWFRTNDVVMIGKEIKKFWIRIG
jgi:hypothetical protein